MSNDYYKQISLSGEHLLNAMNSLTQLVKIHMDNNDVLKDAVQKFIQLVEQSVQNAASISIHLMDGRFYFQEEKVHLRPANTRLFNRLMQFMENRSIYGFHIQSRLNDVSFQKIIFFFRLLNQAENHEDPSTWLTIKMEENDLNWISVALSPLSQMGATFPAFDEMSRNDELEMKKGQIRKTYSHVLCTIKEVAGKISSNQVTGMRKSVRLVQKMVDLISEDEPLFLGISTLRIYDDYTYAHSLNVAIISMCLGKRIGLSHKTLERLGLCGLFHDLGKVEIPKQILNKQESLNEEEFNLLKTHSMHSARLILKLKSKRDRRIRILVPPFEHHMGYDHSGYPKVPTGPRISLFGRILTIADVYDAITSPRIYRSSAMSPDKALSHMMSRSGTHFDPILLKVFVNMLGVCPVGTLLKLDTGEIGIVMKPSKSNDGKRPIVQLLIQGDQQTYEKGIIVDLSDKDSVTGKYCRNISERMHPSSMGIQAAAFLV